MTTYLTSAIKDKAALAFKLFVASYPVKSLNHGIFSYNNSHDGFCFTPLHSNSFGMNEIEMIMAFCVGRKYSFSFFHPITMAQTHAIYCEINIWEDDNNKEASAGFEVENKYGYYEK